MQHQDWEPVVFKKKQEVGVVSAGKRALSQLPSKQFRELDTAGDIPKVVVFEKDFVQWVIARRVENKWGQAELARRANIPVARIQNLERGKEVYASALKQKLNRVLRP